MPRTLSPSVRALRAVILDIEAAHFRTVDDSGACTQALTIWNGVRRHAGLPSLWTTDLPAWNGKAYVMPEGSHLLSAMQARKSA